MSALAVLLVIAVAVGVEVLSPGPEGFSGRVSRIGSMAFLGWLIIQAIKAL